MAIAEMTQKWHLPAWPSLVSVCKLHLAQPVAGPTLARDEGAFPKQLFSPTPRGRTSFSNARQMDVRESALFVSQHASHVGVDNEGCVRAAAEIYAQMKERNYSTGTWNSHPLNPKTCNSKTVDWIFTVDLLNFSFWSAVDENDSGSARSQRYAVEYNGVLYTGYWSLCAAINRALDEGIAFTSPRYWLAPDLEDKVRHVFRSATPEQIPLFEERVRVLREAGGVFRTLGIESFSELIPRAHHSAARLVEIVRTNFPCFNDVHLYKGHEVKILKRAQILVADIWACFDNTSYGRFDDIDQITMFADYRVPQILHTLGCLKYSALLETYIRAKKTIDSGDEREIELRACSIQAVEQIVAEIHRAMATNDPSRSKINAILVDFYLWDAAKELQAQIGGEGDQIPCHRTRSVFY